jgi:hypothetical protein
MNETIINLIADAFGGLSYKLIPFLIFQLSLSGFLSWIYLFVEKKVNNEDLISYRRLITLSIVFCSLSFFAKYSVQLSLFWGLIALGVLLKSSNFSLKENTGFIFCIGISGIIGAGFVIPALIVYSVVVLLMFLSRIKKV